MSSPQTPVPPESSTPPIPPDAPSPAPRFGSQPLKAAAILSVLYFLSKLTGLFQQQIISATLERPQTDAYIAAFRLTDVVNYLIAGGALSITFIPLFTELREKGREDEAWKFFSSLFMVLGLLTAGVVLFAWIAAAPLMSLLAPGLKSSSHPPGTFDLAVVMSQIILPGQIFFVTGGIIVAALNAQKRFAATGFTGALYNVVAVLVAVALWVLTKDPTAFAWGILLGAAAGYLLLPLIAVLTGPRELRPRWHWSFRHPMLRQYFWTALPIMLGVSFPVIDQVIVGYFASEVGGGLTYLGNGNRLMIVAQAVLAQAASVAAFPYLASDSAAQDWTRMATFLRQGLRRLMLITLPLSTLMVLTARPTVDLLFGYGKYKGFIPLHETAVAYAFYSIGLFAWTGQQLVARGFYALKDTKTPTIIGSVITVVFFIPLVRLCVSGPEPIMLLALATSIGACVHFVAMIIALEKKLAQPTYGVALGSHRVCGTLLRTATACLLMGITGLIVLRLLDGLSLHGKTGSLIKLFAISAVSLPVFAIAANRFQIPEWAWLSNRVIGRLKRR